MRPNPTRLAPVWASWSALVLLPKSSVHSLRPERILLTQPIAVLKGVEPTFYCLVYVKGSGR
jgi:hypothetical protein